MANHIKLLENIPQRIEEIKSAMKIEKDKRMYERYQSVYLYLSGSNRNQIAVTLNRHVDTISSYVSAYKTKGLQGMSMQYSPGRPHLLTEEQEQLFYQTVVEKTPTDVGFPANMNWTSPLAKDWIEREFKVIFAARSVRELMHRLGLSYTKPTYTLANADPQKQEIFKQEFDEVKKITSMRN